MYSISPPRFFKLSFGSTYTFYIITFSKFTLEKGVITDFLFQLSSSPPSYLLWNKKSHSSDNICFQIRYKWTSGESNPSVFQSFTKSLLYKLKPVFDSGWLPDSAQVLSSSLHALAPHLRFPRRSFVTTKTLLPTPLCLAARAHVVSRYQLAYAAIWYA